MGRLVGFEPAVCVASASFHTIPIPQTTHFYSTIATSCPLSTHALCKRSVSARVALSVYISCHLFVASVTVLCNTWNLKMKRCRPCSAFTFASAQLCAGGEGNENYSFTSVCWTCPGDLALERLRAALTPQENVSAGRTPGSTDPLPAMLASAPANPSAVASSRLPCERLRRVGALA